MAIFTGIPGIYYGLLMLMTIDFGMGVLAAGNGQGRLDPELGRLGLRKKLATFGVVVAVLVAKFLVIGEIPETARFIGPMPAPEVAAGWYAFWEVASILKHAKRLGIRLPPGLRELAELAERKVLTNNKEVT